MQLEFYGAAGEVTGSCHILTINGHRVLLDCGMIQGSRRDEARNARPFPFDARNIDAVVLSHAHIDHSGRLPLLVKRGFRGNIHATRATRDLVEVLLEDSARLSERDARSQNRRRDRKGLDRIEPLYSSSDAQRAIKQVEGHRYGQWIKVVDGLDVCFRDAGHILGSAIVELRLSHGGETRTLVFSGDLGQYDTPILRDPWRGSSADAIVMESTYGGRRHRDRSETVRELGEAIQQASKSGGNVLIPAFAVGRSQEILYQFGKHYEEWEMGRWQIFLDSPMAIAASRIYWDYPHLYDAEATKLRADNDRMPPLPNLRLSESTEESMAINRLTKGAIILAGSGMCNGGRIIHHLRHNLWRRDAHVIIVGYQAVGSLGRRLVERQRFVKIRGEAVKVKAQIHTIGGLSAHGDQQDLQRWYENFENRPPVWLVHGERQAQHELARQLEKEADAKVRLPDPGETLDLSTLG